MTDAELKRVFGEQLALVGDRLVKHVDERIEERLTLVVGQLNRHLDERVDALRAEFGERFDRLETMVDAVAERVATDDEERAAIVAEQRRHGEWIGQLAEHTQTRLTPEPQP